MKRTSPRQKRLTNLFNIGTGPDSKWTDDSPSGELAFAGEGRELPTLDDHVDFLFGQKKAYHKNLVLIQRQIRNNNVLLKDIVNCQKHRAAFQRLARMGNRNLEGMEDMVDGWRDTLCAYDDLVHSYKGMCRRYYEQQVELLQLRASTGGNGEGPTTTPTVAGGESPLIPRGWSGFCDDTEEHNAVGGSGTASDKDDESTALMLTPPAVKKEGRFKSASPDY